MKITNLKTNKTQLIVAEGATRTSLAHLRAFMIKLKGGTKNREELERDYEIETQQNTGKFRTQDRDSQHLYNYEKNDGNVTIESTDNQATLRYFFIL